MRLIKWIYRLFTKKKKKHTPELTNFRFMLIK